MIFFFFSPATPAAAHSHSHSTQPAILYSFEEEKKKAPGSYPTHQNLCTQFVLSSKTFSFSSFRNKPSSRGYVFIHVGVYTHIYNRLLDMYVQLF
jgi:hypothetical protein